MATWIGRTKRGFLQKTLDPTIALATIALFDVFLFLLIGAWTVGGGETMMTGLIAEVFMGDALHAIPFWQLVFVPDGGYWKIYISLGMLFGAVVGAVASKEFSSASKTVEQWVLATIGGLLMGVGIRLAFVCNVSTFSASHPSSIWAAIWLFQAYRGAWWVRSSTKKPSACE